MGCEESDSDIGNLSKRKTTYVRLALYVDVQTSITYVAFSGDRMWWIVLNDMFVSLEEYREFAGMGYCPWPTCESYERREIILYMW